MSATTLAVNLLTLLLICTLAFPVPTLAGGGSEGDGEGSDPSGPADGGGQDGEAGADSDNDGVSDSSENAAAAEAAAQIDAMGIPGLGVSPTTNGTGEVSVSFNGVGVGTFSGTAAVGVASDISAAMGQGMTPGSDINVAGSFNCGCVQGGRTGVQSSDIADTTTGATYGITGVAEAEITAQVGSTAIGNIDSFATGLNVDGWSTPDVSIDPGRFGPSDTDPFGAIGVPPGLGMPNSVTGLGFFSGMSDDPPSISTDPVTGAISRAAEERDDALSDIDMLSQIPDQISIQPELTQAEDDANFYGKAVNIGTAFNQNTTVETRDAFVSAVNTRADSTATTYSDNVTQQTINAATNISINAFSDDVSRAQAYANFAANYADTVNDKETMTAEVDRATVDIEGYLAQTAVNTITAQQRAYEAALRSSQTRSADDNARTAALAGIATQAEAAAVAAAIAAENNDLSAVRGRSIETAALAAAANIAAYSPAPTDSVATGSSDNDSDLGTEDDGPTRGLGAPSESEEARANSVTEAVELAQSELATFSQVPDQIDVAEEVTAFERAVEVGTQIANAQVDNPDAVTDSVVDGFVGAVNSMAENASHTFADAAVESIADALADNAINQVGIAVSNPTNFSDYSIEAALSRSQEYTATAFDVESHLADLGALAQQPASVEQQAQVQLASMETAHAQLSMAQIHAAFSEQRAYDWADQAQTEEARAAAREAELANFAAIGLEAEMGKAVQAARDAFDSYDYDALNQASVAAQAALSQAALSDNPISQALAESITSQSYASAIAPSAALDSASQVAQDNAIAAMATNPFGAMRDGLTQAAIEGRLADAYARNGIPSVIAEAAAIQAQMQSIDKNAVFSVDAFPDQLGVSVSFGTQDETHESIANIGVNFNSVDGVLTGSTRSLSAPAPASQSTSLAGQYSSSGLANSQSTVSVAEATAAAHTAAAVTSGYATNMSDAASPSAQAAINSFDAQTASLNRTAALGATVGRVGTTEQQAAYSIAAQTQAAVAQDVDISSVSAAANFTITDRAISALSASLSTRDNTMAATQSLRSMAQSNIAAEHYSQVQSLASLEHSIQAAATLDTAHRDVTLATIEAQLADTRQQQRSLEYASLAISVDTIENVYMASLQAALAQHTEEAASAMATYTNIDNLSVTAADDLARAAQISALIDSAHMANE